MENQTPTTVDNEIRSLNALPETAEVMQRGFGILALVHFNRNGLTPAMLLKALNEGLNPDSFKRFVIAGMDIQRFAKSLSDTSSCRNFGMPGVCKGTCPDAPVQPACSDAQFLAIATMNPLEQEGVYALSDEQRDRFLLKVTPSGSKRPKG
jgi:hypothetical protein